MSDLQMWLKDLKAAQMEQNEAYINLMKAINGTIDAIEESYEK